MASQLESIVMGGIFSYDGSDTWKIMYVVSHDTSPYIVTLSTGDIRRNVVQSLPYRLQILYRSCAVCMCCMLPMCLPSPGPESGPRSNRPLPTSVDWVGYRFYLRHDNDNHVDGMRRPRMQGLLGGDPRSTKTGVKGNSITSLGLEPGNRLLHVSIWFRIFCSPVSRHQIVAKQGDYLPS